VAVGVGLAGTPAFGHGLAAAPAGQLPQASVRPRIQTSIDTTRVTVGDRIGLTVTVEHPSGSRVRWPDSLRMAPFEVFDASVEPTRTAEGRSLTTARFSLAAFELGALEVPGFDVEVVAPDGTVETLETDRFAIEVQSVGVDESGDIRQIRGPLGIPVSAFWILIALLALLVPALLAYVLYRRFRSKPEQAPGVRGPPPRPAHEVALEALGALEGSALLARGAFKEYHVRAAEILRTYVERRFRVDALEMTTKELLHALEQGGVAEGVRTDLRRFLDQCDLVKFAKGVPSIDGSRALVALGRRIVEASIPTVPVPDIDEHAEDPKAGGHGAADADPRPPRAAAASTTSAPEGA
jgi:hypothetical protein